MRKDLVIDLAMEGKKHGQHIIMAKIIKINEVLEVLVETYNILIWILLEVILPLVLIIGVGLLLERIEKGGAFAYTLGNGSLFIFAILLLVGVLRTRMEVKTLSVRMKRDINWSNCWLALFFLIEIIFTLVYAYNVFMVYYCGIVKDMPLEAVLTRFRTWSVYGLIGVGIAFFFALATMLSIRRTLLKARITSVKVSR